MPTQSIASKKINSAATVMLSQNEIELKSLKGKSGDSLSAKLPSNDATVSAETTTIKGKQTIVTTFSTLCNQFD